jgi:hypothetical protein
MKGSKPKLNAVRMPTDPKNSSRQPDNINSIFVCFLRRCSFAKYNAGIINPLYAVTRPIINPVTKMLYPCVLNENIISATPTTNKSNIHLFPKDGYLIANTQLTPK